MGGNLISNFLLLSSIFNLKDYNKGSKRVAGEGDR
jgi:hypothetical protein